MAAQDPSAPSWQFLQERWTAVKACAAGHAGGSSGEQAGVTDEAASLLLVISHTTAGFPKEQAEELAAELLKVRGGNVQGMQCSLGGPTCGTQLTFSTA